MCTLARRGTIMKNLWIFTGILSLFLMILSDNAFSANKADCERWCNDNSPSCGFRDPNVFCKGSKHQVIKSFRKGTGNWYACGLTEYGSRSLKNKSDCETWCKGPERCESCKKTAGCGPGYASIKTFGGHGENWYACRKK